MNIKTFAASVDFPVTRYLVVIYVQELVDDGLWLPLYLLLGQSRFVWGRDCLRFHCPHENNSEKQSYGYKTIRPDKLKTMSDSLVAL